MQDAVHRCCLCTAVHYTRGGIIMKSLKRIAAAALSAALCFSMTVPAYADHYRTPKSIKGVLINEHAQIPDVLEVGASQVILNFPMSWAFSSQLSVFMLWRESSA